MIDGFCWEQVPFWSGWARPWSRNGGSQRRHRRHRPKSPRRLRGRASTGRGAALGHPGRRAAAGAVPAPAAASNDTPLGAGAGSRPNRTSVPRFETLREATPAAVPVNDPAPSAAVPRPPRPDQGPERPDRRREHREHPERRPARHRPVADIAPVAAVASTPPRSPTRRRPRPRPTAWWPRCSARSADNRAGMASSPRRLSRRSPASARRGPRGGDRRPVVAAARPIRTRPPPRRAPPRQRPAAHPAHQRRDRRAGRAFPAGHPGA